MNENNLNEIAGKIITCLVDNPHILSDADVEHLVGIKIFPTDLHQAAYGIIKENQKSGKRTDLTLLKRELQAKGFEQKEIFTEIAVYHGEYIKKEDIAEYVKQLFDAYLSTSFIKKIAAIHKSSAPTYDRINDLKNYINDVELKINNVSKGKSMGQIFDEAMQEIDDLRTGVRERYGYSWGLKDMDDKTGGIGPGINILAATKGGGKTSKLINIIIKNSVRANNPSLFFSLEMKATDIIKNTLANLVEINSKSIREGNLSEEDMASLKAQKERVIKNLTIDETGGITWQYFETKIREFRRKHKIPKGENILVMLDYLQLMKNSPDEMKMSKEERVEHIMTEIMRVCKHENVCLVLLSQFSRDLDKRGNAVKNSLMDGRSKDKVVDPAMFRPTMSDLKGSGAIEASAVTIVLLYRPEYYGIKEHNGKDLTGLCEITIAKNRFGPPVTLYAKFEGKYSRFSDYVDEGIKSTGAEDAF